MGSNALHQVLNYSTSSALKRVVNADSIVCNAAMPRAIAIPRFNPYQSRVMVQERVLCRIGYQLRNDETQPLAIFGRQHTFLDRPFAPSPAGSRIATVSAPHNLSM
jgi:hypothetical protein